MTRVRRSSHGNLASMLLLLSATWALSCRDVPPPKPHNQNLGDGGTLLLPSRTSRLDAALKDGAAEWHPFRELAAQDEPSTDQTDDGEDTGDVQAEIREMIADYNSLFADHDYEELSVYHVEGQQDAIEARYRRLFDLMDKLGELHTLLLEKLPEATDRVAAVFEVFKALADKGVGIDSLEVVSEGEVTGKFRAVALQHTCRFLLIEDQWYIELSDMPGAPQAGEMFDAAKAVTDGLLQALRSGQSPADQLLGQVEALMKSLPLGGTTEADSEIEDEG